MELALLWIISAVIGGGVTGALVITWGFALRVARLEKHVLSQRLTGNANKRWNSDEDLLRQLQAAQTTKPGKVERYANDFD